MSCVMAGWRRAGPPLTLVEPPFGRAGSIHRSMRSSMAARTAGSGATQSGRSRSRRRRRRGCHSPAPASPARRWPADGPRCATPAARSLRARVQARSIAAHLHHAPRARDVAAPQLVRHQIRRHRQPLVAAAAGENHLPSAFAAARSRGCMYAGAHMFHIGCGHAGAELERVVQQPPAADGFVKRHQFLRARAATPPRSGSAPRWTRRPGTPATTPAATGVRSRAESVDETATAIESSPPLRKMPEGPTSIARSTARVSGARTVELRSPSSHSTGFPSGNGSQ